MSAIEDFVNKISSVRLPNTFNPYGQLCAECDSSHADEIRRNNLKEALNAAVRLKVRTVWVARDLGYRGGRRTGLALTDEAHLSEYSSILGGVSLEKSTKGPSVKERTSTVIWRMARMVNEPVFMWNVFPLHPHEHGRPFTNRCHTPAERAALGWVLQDVLSILNPERLYAIGRDSQAYLDSVGCASVALRHPSYGGQKEFARQIEDEYQLTLGNSGDNEQLVLI